MDRRNGLINATAWSECFSSPSMTGVRQLAKSDRDETISRCYNLATAMIGLALLSTLPNAQRIQSWQILALKPANQQVSAGSLSQGGSRPYSKHQHRRSRTVQSALTP